MKKVTLAMARARMKGVTLIELMIVVVIIGILAGIAYPSYKNYTRQARRSDAQIALTKAAAEQERFRSDCGWYAKTLAGTRACGATSANGVLGNPATSPEGYYSVTVAAGAVNAGSCGTIDCGYTLIAAPVATNIQAGDGNLRLDSMGVKQWDKANDNSYSSKWTDR